MVEGITLPFKGRGRVKFHRSCIIEFRTCLFAVRSKVRVFGERGAHVTLSFGYQRELGKIVRGGRSRQEPFQCWYSPVGSAMNDSKESGTWSDWYNLVYAQGHD